LSSIADDEVDLGTWGVPTSVTAVEAYPHVPDNPYPNTWRWSNVTTASLTLMNLAKQNTLNGNWFYAGIFLGIAGGGVLALVPEMSGVLAARRKDKQGNTAEAGALDNLGLAYQQLRRFQEAISCYQDALVIRRETGDRRGEAQTLSNLGLAYQELQQLDKAAGYWRDAATVMRNAGNDVEAARLEQLAANARSRRRHWWRNRGPAAGGLNLLQRGW
jgi:tetratricopeptide (TPR) repeat protein